MANPVYHHFQLTMTCTPTFLNPSPAPAAPLSASSSDFLVILAALTCATLAAAGLAFLTRCSSAPAPPMLRPGGLNRPALRQLPTARFSSKSDAVNAYTECPICLAVFLDGDLTRVLPFCGHVFHVKCIDTWLGRRTSCPSCRRQVEDAAMCRLCGGSERRPDACVASVDDMEAGLP